MSDPTSRPPWSKEQVDSLSGYQHSGVFHPFTCPRRGNGHHRFTSDLGVLTATPDGWICASCDYTQDWAHPWMADGAWELSLVRRILAREKKVDE